MKVNVLGKEIKKPIQRKTKKINHLTPKDKGELTKLAAIELLSILDLVEEASNILAQVFKNGDPDPEGPAKKNIKSADNLLNEALSHMREFQETQIEVLESSSVQSMWTRVWNHVKTNRTKEVYDKASLNFRRLQHYANIINAETYGNNVDDLCKEESDKLKQEASTTPEDLTKQFYDHKINLEEMFDEESETKSGETEKVVKDVN